MILLGLSKKTYRGKQGKTTLGIRPVEIHDKSAAQPYSAMLTATFEHSSHQYTNKTKKATCSLITE